METEDRREAINRVTERIISCVYAVANGLGCGFLEKVYENALAHELGKTELDVSQQHPIQVFYDGVVVGAYVADLVVAGSVLVELKAVKAFEDIHMAQCMNYLRATGLRVCLLVNFGTPKVEIKRIVNEF